MKYKKHLRPPICEKFSKSQMSEVFIKYAASTLLAAGNFFTPALGQEVIMADSIQQATEQIQEEEDVFIGRIVEQQPISRSGYEGFYKK